MTGTGDPQPDVLNLYLVTIALPDEPRQDPDPEDAAMPRFDLIFDELLPSPNDYDLIFDELLPEPT